MNHCMIDITTEPDPHNHPKFAIGNISNKCSLACWFESRLATNHDDSVSREARPIANTILSNEIKKMLFFIKI